MEITLFLNYCTNSVQAIQMLKLTGTVLQCGAGKTVMQM